MPVGRRYIMKSRPGARSYRTFSSPMYALRFALCVSLQRTTDEQLLSLICQTIQIVFLAVAAEIAENLVVDGVGFGS